MSNENLVKPGYYRARAVGTPEQGMTDNGVEQIACRFELLDGEHVGEQLPWYGYFKSADSTRIALNALRAMGWDPEKDGFEDFSNCTEDVTVKVGWNEYNGETRARVDFVNPLGGGLIRNVMTPEQKGNFAAKLSGLYESLKGSLDQPTGGGGGYVPPPIDPDDDVPFQ